MMLFTDKLLRFKKQVEETSNMALLESYSMYTKMDFRTVEEQEALAILRREMLKRMEGYDGQEK